MNIELSNAYIEGDFAWGTSIKEPYLYKINLINGLVEEILPLFEGSEGQFAYYDILVYKKYFVFIPCKSDQVLIVNRINWEKEYITFPTTEERIGKTMLNFFTGIIYNDWLYMFGFSYPGILKMNMKTKEFKCINNWLRRNVIESEVDGCFHMNYCLKESKIYFPFENTSAVMVFDLETEKAEVREIEKRGNGFISIENDEENFWLIPRNAEKDYILKWSADSGETQTIWYPEGCRLCQKAFYKTLKIDDRIMLFAHGGSVNLYIDTHTGKTGFFEDIYDAPMGGARYPNVKLENRKVMFVLSDRYICWDYDTKEKKEVFYVLDNKMLKRIENNKIKEKFEKKQNRVFRENTDLNLESYLKYIHVQ